MSDLTARALSSVLFHSKTLEGASPSESPEKPVFWPDTATHSQNMVKFALPDFPAYLSGEAEQADA